jgi:hypothetical protein
MEYAHERLEHTAQHGHDPTVSWSRLAAVIIAVLAGALALTEFGAKDAQTAYLAEHVAASDTWAQYQAKSVRRAIYLSTAESMETSPAASDAAAQEKIRAARANAERMQSEPGADGMDQLAEKAREFEHARDHQQHRYHGMEIASSGLQLAIVLASVAVVTSFIPLLWLSCLLGLGSAAYGALAALALV